MTELTDTSTKGPAEVTKKKEKIDWAAEGRGVFWLVLAVLGVHSFIAKPFYIPSESMMPILLKGDRLVVTKYAYGWSWVSPTFHILPPMKGRLFGSVPERGDVVILTHPTLGADYIKRVIGLPGDRIEVNAGQLIINGKPVARKPLAPILIPVDGNAPCTDLRYSGLLVDDPGKQPMCAMPAYRETLPNGRSFDTIDLGNSSEGDFFGPYTVPGDHLFLMGDNRDNSSDSRFSLEQNGLGGAVPIENIGGRAELITFSLDGGFDWRNPLTWIQAFRGGRAGNSLRPEIEKQ